MGRHGFGTVYRAGNQFVGSLKSIGLKKTTRQLSEALGRYIAPTKQETTKAWREYLATFRASQTLRERLLSPLKTRIATLEAMIAEKEAIGEDVTYLKGELQKASSYQWTTQDVEEADTPWIDSDAYRGFKLISPEIDLLDPVVLQQIFAKEPTKKPEKKHSFNHHLDLFISNGTYSESRKKVLRTHIGHFINIVGDDIKACDSMKELEFFSWLKAQEQWNDTGKHEILKNVKAFLRRIPSDLHQYFILLSSASPKLNKLDGEKIQFTNEELKTAFANAEGDLKLALLLGLNCGMYWSDMDLLTADDLNKAKETGLLTWKRSKLNRNKAQTLITSRLWAETLELLKTMEYKSMDDKYGKWAKKLDLPSHKSLRKTGGQWINDHVSSDAANLYFGRPSSGVNRISYIRPYTEQQIKNLGDALDKLRTHYKTLGVF